VNIAETNAIPLGCPRDEGSDQEDGEEDDDNIKLGVGSMMAVGREAGLPGAPYSGMFEMICRVNHSCSPNTGWRWDEPAQELGEFSQPLVPLFHLGYRLTTQSSML